MRFSKHLRISDGSIVLGSLVFGKREVTHRPLAVTFSRLLPGHGLHHLGHQSWMIQKTFLPIPGSDHTTHVSHHKLQGHPLQIIRLVQVHLHDNIMQKIDYFFRSQISAIGAIKQTGPFTVNFCVIYISWYDNKSRVSQKQNQV